MDVILKHLYFLQRKLNPTNKDAEVENEEDVKIKKTDTIGFYEVIDNEKEKFPAMVDKIRDIELRMIERLKKNYVKLEKKKGRDSLQSDFEIFDINVSPRTKRRIKYNSQDSNQLLQQNFHEKIYGKLIKNSHQFYSLTKSSNMVKIG
jgi:hypothetical protein